MRTAGARPHDHLVVLDRQVDRHAFGQPRLFRDPARQADCQGISPAGDFRAHG
jgi:hypothetical protein